MEADLAFRGVDLRDLYRVGTGLTPRRLLVLLRGLPPDAVVWEQMARAEEERDQVRIRAKHEANKAHYARQREGG